MKLDSDFADKLQEINLTIIDQKRCKEMVKTAEIMDSHICTLNSKIGEGACHVSFLLIT